MKLRELTGVRIPVWAGSIGQGGKMPVGDVGVVTAVETARGMRGIRIELEVDVTFGGYLEPGLERSQAGKPTRRPLQRRSP